MSRDIYGTIQWDINPVKSKRTIISKSIEDEIQTVIPKIHNELINHSQDDTYSAHSAVSLTESGFVTPEILTEIDSLYNRVNDLIDAANNRLPRGLIVPYDNKVSTIPNMWSYCDGTDFTPDIRGKYVLGGSTYNTYPLHSSGGSDNWKSEASKLDSTIVKHNHAIDNAFYLERSGYYATQKYAPNKYAYGANSSDYDDSLAYFSDYTDYYGSSIAGSVQTSSLPASVNLPYIMYNPPTTEEYTVTVNGPKVGGRILIDGENVTSIKVPSGTIIKCEFIPEFTYGINTFTVNNVSRGTPCYVCVETDTTIVGTTYLKKQTITINKSPYGVTTVNGENITKKEYVFNTKLTINTKVDPDYIFTGYKIETV